MSNSSTIVQPLVVSALHGKVSAEIFFGRMLRIIYGLLFPTTFVTGMKAKLYRSKGDLIHSTFVINSGAVVLFKLIRKFSMISEHLTKSTTTNFLFLDAFRELPVKSKIKF